VGNFGKTLHRSNSAARGQIAFKFHKMVLCGSTNAAKLSSPQKVESNMADDALIFNLRTSISLERLKLETSNLVCALTTIRKFNGIQKLGQRGRDPVSVT